MKDSKRCSWCGNEDIEIQYHDHEWGQPLHDEQKLFEFLCLEGAQAGLSWLTILKKRENYRHAFDHFDAKKIAKYDDKKIESLLQNKGIIRNKRKISAFIKNANAFLKVQEEYGTFDNYIWSFLEHNTPIQNKWNSLSEIPASTPLSTMMSKELKKKGFSFVGPVICYAFMQAIGMVNDHTTDCFRYAQLTSCNKC